MSARGAFPVVLRTPPAPRLTRAMQRTHAPIHPLRRVLAVLIWILVPIVALAAGLAGFFGSAILADWVWVFSAAGIALAFVAGFFAARLGFAAWGARRPRRAAAVLASVVVAALTGVIGIATFVPIDYGYTPDSAPAGTEYWDLPSGSRIAYLHAAPTGEPRGESIVVLHGGPGTPGEGLPPGTDLLTAAGYDVYGYDQVGGGRSTRLADVTQYTVARQVDDLEAIRELIDAERMTLIGRSWGASLAAQYLAAHPDRVAAAVFVSPGALWPGAFDGEVSDPWATLPASSRQEFDDLLSSPRVILSTLLLGFNPNAAHAFMGDAEADAMLHASAVVGQNAGVCPGDVAREPHGNAQGFYVNQLTSEDFDATPDPRPALAELDVPVLVIRGECDFVRAEVADDYRDVFQASELISIAGAGHAVWGDAPPEYLDALTAFLIEGAVAE